VQPPFLILFVLRMSRYIQKRNADVIFSAVAAPIQVRLWNTDTFERLNRTLYSWLEGEIGEGERIRRIQWLVSTFNQSGEVREWVDIKTDQDARRMMQYMFKIVLMVVIA
jgi:hypothetical protein